MTVPIRLNSSKAIRRGSAFIHAGLRLFVEKMRGCVSPFVSVTNNKERHIYIFYRRIGGKPLSMRVFLVEAVSTN